MLFDWSIEFMVLITMTNWSGAAKGRRRRESLLEVHDSGLSHVYYMGASLSYYYRSKGREKEFR